MGTPNLGRDTKMGIQHGSQAPGPGYEAPSRPAIRGVSGDHGERAMKVRDGLVKVYEPGRLQRAWQRVRVNAGAAGIDQMTVDEFAQQEDHLLARMHAKLQAGHYRFQPTRRVLIPKAGSRSGPIACCRKLARAAWARSTRPSRPSPYDAGWR